MAIQGRFGRSFLGALAAVATLMLLAPLVEGQLQSTYQSSNTYYDRYLLDSPYNLCRDPLMARANITATTEASQRTSENSRLWGGSAWTAENSDFQQSLIIDLGEVKNVTGIATQGRAHSDEYVIEYMIQYGSNGKDWIDYKEVDGSPKLFPGNTDGDYVVRNDFDQPIIAQWIRINPTRWADRISLRMELYGCNYIPDVLHFHGKAFIRRNLNKFPVASLRDTFRLRFKTNHENGVLLYSRGSQGDYFALQMVENRMLLNINLGMGAKYETSITLGSLLDDNLFHEVVISRERRDIILSVDRVRSRDRVRGDFHKLNLDRYFYIGGVPHMEEGLIVNENFTGCIENMYLNHSNVIAGFKSGIAYDDRFFNYEDVGGVIKGCPSDDYTAPVTFMNSDAFVKLTGYEGSYNMNVSLEFRTYEENGLLMFHKFSSEGFVKLFLEDARIKVQISGSDMPTVELDPNKEQTYSDGKWHQVEIFIGQNKAVLTVDRNPMDTTRLLKISTGAYYMIGGGVTGQSGFVGCMRHITIDGNGRLPSDWRHDQISSKDDIALESCHAVDRCSPNPCEHGGVCKQNSEEFYCECEDTGYTGAVCHTSLNFKSCMHYKFAHPDSREAEDVVIDIDGSGPLAPFHVHCEFFPDGRNITNIRHNNEATTDVDGGEITTHIDYSPITMDMMEAMINRSISCVQKLGYGCLHSALLNTPIADSDNFQPSGYWVSRQNRVMDYWAGSLPGSRKCECGLVGVCQDPKKWCNCDATDYDGWLYDGGEITHKEYLPVRALTFKDTGTPLDKKKGRFSLGPLECNGDMLFDNVVTFRRDDAVIELPPVEFGQSGDIYFEFKTTSIKTMVLIHSEGSNGDFIRVSIISGNHIQFEYESGKGPQGVTVETAYRLDDDQWHSVLVERNRKEAMVVVDGARKGHVQEPRGPVRPMLLDNNLLIGATRDFSDGFVGCIRAMVINGVVADLVHEATKNPWGLYGVGVGCKGKCSKNPCMNGGECREGYDHFTCDCRWTPFKGPICADEIGINMRTNYMVKYDFKGNYKSTIAEKIHVGFTTTDPKGFLLGAYSDISKEYLTLMVSNSGHLRLVFDFGFERQEMVFTEQNFMTGQYHDVRIERFDQGRKLKMKVDNYEPQIYSFDKSLKSSADAQFNNIRYLYIGKNESMREGFVGCISRVEFDEIIPLKLLFQEDQQDNIRAFPETITEDFCGIEPVTLPPEEEETRRPPHVDEAAIRGLYATPVSVLLTIVLVLIILLIVVFCVCCAYHYKNRQKGAYLTREDEGARDAFDADTAVLQGRTGHQVEKKKEWFI